MKKFVPLLLLLVAGWQGASALEPFTITDIRVEGLERVSAGTVFNYLPLKIGDQIDDTAAQDAIRTLFKTGFFNDVQLRRDGTALIVTIEERPSIARIEFSGNKKIKEKDLREGLLQADFAEGRIFNQSLLDRVVQDLENQYFGESRYSASVEANVSTLERNRVAIDFIIDEGRAAKIKQVAVVGNEAFTDKQLLKRFKLSTKSALNFISKKDRYSKQKLEADLASLESFYQNHGYLDFKIVSTGVSISPDKEDIFITVALEEGDQYTVGDVQIEPNPLVDVDVLEPMLSVIPGETFSRRAIVESRTVLSGYLADDGYAFANVNAIPEVDPESNTVSFTFTLDPGRRVYVRRIDITGNTATHDEVVRRELRQIEGGWYSAEKIRRSRIRLQRLGFFEDVTIETPRVPGTVDQVDMNVAVKERSTGSFLFGIGFSDADGLLLQGSVAQQNLFGTGKELRVAIDTSDITDVFDISYINPYYTVDGVSRGFNLTVRRIDAAEADTAAYISETAAIGVTYQIPLSEFNAIKAGGSLERVELESTPETPDEFREFITEHPRNDNIKGVTSWSRDTRDSLIYTTSGFLRRASADVTLPGSDLTYYKLLGRVSWYKPLSSLFVMRLGGELGYGEGYSDIDQLPFYENFFAGGINSVRGYKARSLGPRDSNGDPTGASQRLLLNAEFLMPFPGAAETKDRRLGLFVDGGQVYSKESGYDLGELRYSAGLAFYWFSPVGPLTISLGEPINDESGDETETLQFTFGTLFR